MSMDDYTKEALDKLYAETAEEDRALANAGLQAWVDSLDGKSGIRNAFYHWKYKLNRIYWWFIHRLHPYHRYHILNLGIEPGWHDIDYRMLYACFTLFCEFVEGEDGLENLRLQSEIDPKEYQVSQEYVDKYKHDYEEAIYLYNWWKKVYPVNKDDIYMNEKLYNDENEHLIRLIKIRGVCWT